MTESRDELVAYRIARARETLEDARILVDQERWASAANRLFYACFYAVSALLLRHDMSSAKHSGVRGLFNLNFVKTGIVSKELSRTFNDLFELRQEGDYADLVHVEESQVRPMVAEVGTFVEEIAALALAKVAPSASDDQNPGRSD